MGELMGEPIRDSGIGELRTVTSMTVTAKYGDICSVGLWYICNSKASDLYTILKYK